MKFFTLLKKDIKDAIPWILVSIISLYILCLFSVRMRLYSMNQEGYGGFKNGEIVNQNYILREDVLQGSTVLMFFITILLGLALGFIHFWKPGIRKTWQFIIHRSTTRTAILLSKISVAAIMVICMSLAWLLFVKIVSNFKSVIIPPEAGIVRLGVFYAFLSFIAYISIALCALTKARWYTTKLFSIIFGLVMYAIIISQAYFYRAVFIFVLAFVVLIIQLYQVFLQREF